MLRDFRKIQLQGACFKTPQILPILHHDGKTPKISLIYGRNGSGKSTIARAFRKIKGIDIRNVQKATLLDEQGRPITLTDEERARIFVYDEDFINTNVRVESDSLGTIVMLGDQVEITEQIALATKDLEDARKDLEEMERIFGEFEDKMNPISPDYYLIDIMKILRSSNGWAARQSKIENLRRNSNVNEHTYTQFITRTPKKSRDELIIEFESEYSKYKNAQSGISLIKEVIPCIHQTFKLDDISVANDLLKQVIESPELTAREQYLLELVQCGHTKELETTTREFARPEITICPKCHQSLSTEYKNELIKSIKKVLSEEVEQHQKRLREFYCQKIDIDLSPFCNLYSYTHCLELIEIINNAIQQNNELLDAKVNKPFTPLSKELTDFSESLCRLNSYLKQMEDERTTYNETVSNVDRMKKNLKCISDDMAYWEVINYSQKHDDQKRKKEEARANLTQANTLYSMKLRFLETLQAQRQRIDIAINVINEGLKYIFFSESRLQIRLLDNQYRLYCNNFPVKPNEVSLGERNIIGLCYFFTSILHKKRHDLGYSDEYLLIIDDPLSSFDFENRIGILSYLKILLEKFLLGNPFTKVVIMTHDLLTAFDIGTISSKLVARCNPDTGSHGNFIYLPNELKDQKLSRFQNKRNEYNSLISQVYEYARGQNRSLEPYIGNIIRQVLEAFSTFEYRKGIDEVSVDDDILSILENDEHKKHFRNFMYRLVLNGGSHRKNQVEAMGMDFFPYISEEEKIRTAREILCFIELLNAPHVRAHLGPEAENEIKRWCEDISQ